MKLVVLALFSIHALLHLLGAVHPYRPITQFKTTISKKRGLLWLLACVVLLTATILFAVENPMWWVTGAIGLVLSQALIITSWKDAKAGTVMNVLLLLSVLISIADYRFASTFRKDAEEIVQQPKEENLLTEEDIAALPEAVKRYIRYSGAIGKPEVYNFRISFSGRIRKNEDAEWMPVETVQYNSLQPARRLFFMKATMLNLPVTGYHRYTEDGASMDIRLFSTFTVQEQHGPAMEKAETVTFFNDMCCMAPATLIDPRIQWLDTSGDTVQARFIAGINTIHATLVFNSNGQLINFISNDRAALQDDGTMIEYPWSTPATNYQSFNGINIASEAKTIYSYPDGEFCYGEFRIVETEYNCTTFQP